MISLEVVTTTGQASTINVQAIVSINGKQTTTEGQYFDALPRDDELSNRVSALERAFIQVFAVQPVPPIGADPCPQPPAFSSAASQ